MKLGSTALRTTVAGLAIIALSGCNLINLDSPTPSQSLSDAIDTLTVTDEDRTGYERNSFSDWTDPDRNGCNTRHEVLIAEDVSDTATVDDCDGTINGEWISMYDDERVTDSRKLDIDHFVPLAEAWDSGASQWTKERRVAYATFLDDDRHLIAVTASTNRSKADKDPAEWMPPNELVHCEYIATWVAIKAQWELSVDEKELQAIKDIAKTCTDTEVKIISLD